MRILCVSLCVFLVRVFAGEVNAPPSPQLKALNAYFAQRVSELEGQLDREVKTKEDWFAKKDEYRRQLAEMLGLDPLPPRTDLHATKTREFEHEGIVVENIHYQSMPGLYVTANLYRPKVVEKPLPTILYGCGHSNMLKDGISCGNKAGYEHHGVWYAKHGFVCLVYDTVELGEIRGVHHGTYDKNRFWWWSRGYTPAGVEAWAGIRGLDYLETRPEVDRTRFGVAGRSGGGAYSWYVAALDERVKCAAPTAGITSLRNHVVDGCVEGHCDCMYFVNTYRWDYDKLAALVAPRPLCICNTDKDTIFPLDGVMKIYNSTRRIYKLLDAEKNIGLQIAEGPHADTQPLNTGEFHWMTRFLQGAAPLSTLDAPAVKSIPIEKLRVFTELPKDERNTRIDESFVAMAKDALPANKEEWGRKRDEWMKALREKCFAAWDSKGSAPDLGFEDGWASSRRTDSKYVIKTDHVFNCPLRIITSAAVINLERIENVELRVDDSGEFLAPYKENMCVAYFCPRGAGNLNWNETIPDGSDEKTLARLKKSNTQRLRRFYLIGETLASQQVWDIRCAIRTLRKSERLKKCKLSISASGAHAVNVLFASLFEDNLTLELSEFPHSLMPPNPEKGSPISGNEPVYLNVLKVLDLPQAVALAAERHAITIYDDDRTAWKFALDATEKFGFGQDKGLRVLPTRD